MDASLTKSPDIEDRQLDPNDKSKLPEGVVITNGEAVITDKKIALELFDKDYTVFITDENGDAIFVDSRAEIEQHSGGFSCMEDEIYLYLNDRERNAPAREKSEIERTMEQRDMAVAEISAITGISVQRINTLPADIRENIINTYFQNAGTMDNEVLAELINSAIANKPLSVLQAEIKAQENPIKTVEEMVEGNYNMIDGVINNLPPEKEEKQSVLAFLRDYKPTSEQPQENDRTR